MADLKIADADHCKNLGGAFSQMRSSGKLVDVTIVCKDQRIKCHQVVLAASSTFFADLLAENPSQHPIIILPGGVNLFVIEALVEYMYRGEVIVSEDISEEFFNCAEILQINTLMDLATSQRLRHENSQMETESEHEMDDETDTESPNEVRDEAHSSNFTSNSAVENPIRIIPIDKLIQPPCRTNEADHAERDNILDLRISSKSENHLKSCMRRRNSQGSSPNSSRPAHVSFDVNDMDKNDEDLLTNLFTCNRKSRKYNIRDIWAALINIDNGMSIKDTAQAYNINSRTLSSYVRRYREKISSHRPQKISKRRGTTL